MRHAIFILGLAVIGFVAGCTSVEEIQSGRGVIRRLTSSPNVSTNTNVVDTTRTARQPRFGQRRMRAPQNASLFGNIFARGRGVIPDNVRRELVSASAPTNCWPTDWICVDQHGNVWVDVARTHEACYGPGIDYNNLWGVGNWGAGWDEGYLGVGRPELKRVIFPMGYFASRGWVHHAWGPFFFQILEKNPNAPGARFGGRWGKQAGECTEVEPNNQTWTYLEGMEEGGSLSDITGEALPGVRDIFMAVFPDEDVPNLRPDELSQWGWKVGFPNMY